MKASPSAIDNFTETAKVYDERNRQLASIVDNMHFLIRRILKELTFHARVLCEGVGTGAEILSFSKAFPEWTFVGVDPSIGMFDVCCERLKEAGVLYRCELINGYVNAVTPGENFDTALSILVGHFVKCVERLNLINCLSPGVYREE